MLQPLEIAALVIYAAGAVITLASGVRFYAYSKRQYGRAPDPLGLIAGPLMWPVFIFMLGPRTVLHSAFTRGYFDLRRDGGSQV